MDVRQRDGELRIEGRLLCRQQGDQRGVGGLDGCRFLVGGMGRPLRDEVGCILAMDPVQRVKDAGLDDSRRATLGPSLHSCRQHLGSEERVPIPDHIRSRRSLTRTCQTESSEQQQRESNMCDDVFHLNALLSIV